MSTGNSSSTGASVGQKVKYVFIFSISTTTKYSPRQPTGAHSKQSTVCQHSPSHPSANQPPQAWARASAATQWTSSTPPQAPRRRATARLNAAHARRQLASPTWRAEPRPQPRRRQRAQVQPLHLLPVLRPRRVRVGELWASRLRQGRARGCEVSSVVCGCVCCGSWGCVGCGRALNRKIALERLATTVHSIQLYITCFVHDRCSDQTVTMEREEARCN